MDHTEWAHPMMKSNVQKRPEGWVFARKKRSIDCSAGGFPVALKPIIE